MNELLLSTEDLVKKSGVQSSVNFAPITNKDVLKRLKKRASLPFGFNITYYKLSDAQLRELRSGLPTYVNFMTIEQAVIAYQISNELERRFVEMRKSKQDDIALRYARYEKNGLFDNGKKFHKVGDTVVRIQGEGIFSYKEVGVVRKNSKGHYVVKNGRNSLGFLTAEWNIVPSK